jgi:hypothetical protein
MTNDEKWIYDRLGIGLHRLGRKDIFEKFQVCFNNTRRVVSFHYEQVNA